MSEEPEQEGIRERLTKQGEDALGRLAQDVLSNPLVSGAISRAFEARESATKAQEVAFSTLNIPSAADLERLTRRVRSVSQRLEGIEDGVDRLDERLSGMAGATGIEDRLTAIEASLEKLHGEVRGIRTSLPDAPESVSRDQERLEVK